MDRLPQSPVKDPPNLIRTGSFSLDQLLSHVDAGPAEESEAFVQTIYEQRRSDLSFERNGQPGR
jgi:hypothetical protein